MDLRQARVELTPAGRRQIAPLVAKARRREALLLRRFRKADVRTFKRLLGTFTEGFEAPLG
jgi:DNA-binding MarR family transcriptional regulator